MRTTTEVFEDHLAKRLAGDLDGDIANNYAENVIFLTDVGIFEGHDGVRHSARELQRRLGDGPYVYNHTLIKSKYAFLEWTAETEDKVVNDGVDSFVIEDGKIVMQTIRYTVSEKSMRAPNSSKQEAIR